MDVRNAERDVIHDAPKAFVGTERDVNHEFDPVCSVRDLQGDPIGLVIFHPAMPIRAKSQNVFVEVLHSRAIAHDEAGVDEMCANLASAADVVIWCL